MAAWAMGGDQGPKLMRREESAGVGREVTEGRRLLLPWDGALSPSTSGEASR